MFYILYLIIFKSPERDERGTSCVIQILQSQPHCTQNSTERTDHINDLSLPLCLHIEREREKMKIPMFEKENNTQTAAADKNPRQKRKKKKLNKEITRTDCSPSLCVIWLWKIEKKRNWKEKHNIFLQEREKLLKMLVRMGTKRWKLSVHTDKLVIQRIWTRGRV